MSRNALEKYLFRFDKDANLQSLLAGDSPAAFDGFSLDEEERKAIRTKDLATLYSWGVHPLLVRNFAGTLGMKYVVAYAERGITG